ncbi:uncharacterized protein LOC124838881 [Vigna umbellata]|uniref:uncharacterized protein LOC124838881 n=1 Tax=Vigna umbellata TaxID=87088 RepID=UPI001F5EF759|nr:uncharacterized protein LOC124838881 [Vigna umbellata]
MRSEITTFMQQETESLYEAWERYKELMRKCPHHALPGWLQVQIFYNGLSPSFKAILDAASGGSFYLKTLEEALETLELMANNTVSMQFDCQNRKAGVLEVNILDAILAQNKLDLTHKLGNMQANNVNTITPVCDFCRGMHQNGECQATQQEAHVNAVGQQQNQFSTNLNANWRHQPTRPWSNPIQFNQSQPPYQYQAQPSNQGNKMFMLENALEKITMQTSTFVDQTSNFMNETRTNFKNHEASIRNLENQIGQLSRQLLERSPGTFPSDTIPNPREQCKAIQLRSGRVLENEKRSEMEREKKKIVDETVEEREENEVEKKCEEKNVGEKNQESGSKMREYVPTIPFPQRLKKQEQAKQFARFLDVFKKLHINIPFAEALEQMPSYAKFMKDLLSKKRKLQEDETIMLTEECIAIIQQKLPPKLKDPGSFVIPCEIGNITGGKALCDLGASINLMSFSIFKRLGIGEVKPTMITLQLADRSITYPYGIVEDVLVKVDKFIFPADFVVLDMEEDAKVPFIFGRPFLATGRALIDVEQGELILRVGDEKVTFFINEAVKHKFDKEDCFKAEIIESLVLEEVYYHVRKNPFERALLPRMEAKELSTKVNDEEVVKCVHQLEVLKPLVSSTRGIEDLHKSESREKDTSKIELKQLPSHLKYRFLDEQKLNPIIVSSELTTKEDELLRVLREYKFAIGWKIEDLQGISPTRDKIYLEDDFKLMCQPQRRLNLIMKEVVRKEVIKLLDAGIIYPISDSEWVSFVHVVPKKGAHSHHPMEMTITSSMF